MHGVPVWRDGGRMGRGHKAETVNEAIESFCCGLVLHYAPNVLDFDRLRASSFSIVRRNGSEVRPKVCRARFRAGGVRERPAYRGA
jgi:hypothetical protein